jgi:hypothetical protein
LEHFGTRFGLFGGFSGLQVLENMVPGEGSGPNVCRFGLSGWLLRDDAGIAALPSVQNVGPSGYELEETPLSLDDSIALTAP